MKFGRTHDIEHEQFDLTPMIDIVLLLIIFFTLTAQFASATREPMDLPSEAGAETRSPNASTMFVDLDRTGGLKLMSSPMTIGEFGAMLRARPAGQRADFDVVVRADRLCAAAHLNALATELARSGVSHWKLATSGESAGGAGGGGR